MFCSFYCFDFELFVNCSRPQQRWTCFIVFLKVCRRENGAPGRLATLQEERKNTENIQKNMTARDKNKIDVKLEEKNLLFQ